MNPAGPFSPDQISADDQELLVAFLDGELSTSESQELQRRLDSEPRLKARLSELKGAWSLLDELPPEPIDVALTASTMEIVAFGEKQEQRKSVIWRWVWISLGLAASLASGFLIHYATNWNRQRQLMLDLPMLLMLDGLEEADSAEWLDELGRIDHLDLLGPDSPSPIAKIPPRWQDRKTWVEKLDPNTQERIARNLEQFERTPPARQSELRSTAKLVMSSDSPNRPVVLQAYLRLLDSLPISERARLLDLPVDERAKQVQILVNRQRVSWYAEKMTTEDRDAIRGWAFEQFSKRPDWVIASLARPSQDWNDEIRGMVQVFIRTRIEQNLSAMSSEAFAELQGHLSSEANNILDSLPENERDFALAQWLEATATFDRRNEIASEPKLAELMEVYQGLTEEQRDQVDLLDSADAVRKLSQMRADKIRRERPRTPDRKNTP